MDLIIFEVSSLEALMLSMASTSPFMAPSARTCACRVSLVIESALKALSEF